MERNGKKDCRILVVGMSQNAGGVENYIINLYRHLDKSCYKFVFTSSNGKVAFQEEIEQNGGIVECVTVSRRNPVKYILSWYRLLKIYTFDVVLFNTSDIVSIDVLKFTMWAKVPIRIIHSHSSHFDGKLNFFHRWQEEKNRKTISQYATQCWACSKAAGEWMFGKNDFTIINNGIETERFAYLKDKRDIIREQLGISHDSFVIGMVGRMIAAKNHLFAIEVFSKLCKQNLDARLILVGEGELREAIEQQVAVLDLQDKVLLLGVRRDVPALLSAMDCLILPSKFEGFPFVIVEAQANGLPCVVSANITRDTDITGAMTYMELSETPSQWAEAIAKVRPSVDREIAHMVVRENGYDIRDVVMKIEALIGMRNKE